MFIPSHFPNFMFFMQKVKKSFHPHTDMRFHIKDYLDEINPIIAILFNYSFYISGTCTRLTLFIQGTHGGKSFYRDLLSRSELDPEKHIKFKYRIKAGSTFKFCPS